MHHREHARERRRLRLPRLTQAVPYFVMGFLAFALLRTVGDLGLERFGGALAAERWNGMLGSAGAASSGCLVLAMAAIGLGTNLRQLRGLGLRPLGVGLIAATSVGAVAAALVFAMTPWVSALAPH
jgi:uncharacterized membrane protein YadS